MPFPQVDPEPPPLPGYITGWALRRVLLRSLLVTGVASAFMWRELASEGKPAEVAFFLLFMTILAAAGLGPASLVELRARAIGVAPGAGGLALAWTLSVVAVASMIPQMIYAVVMVETGSMNAAFDELQRAGRELLQSNDDQVMLLLCTTLLPFVCLGASAIRMELLGSHGRNGYLLFTFPTGALLILAFAIVDLFDGFVFGQRWPRGAKIAPSGARVPPPAEDATSAPLPGSVTP
jgi:hypothetical protein